MNLRRKISSCAYHITNEFGNVFLHSTGSPQPSQVLYVTIAGSVFAAIVVIFIGIGVTVIAVVYLRRKQHARKVDLTRYVLIVALGSVLL